MIKVTSMSKIYNKTKVVDSLTFHVKRGEIFGLLGPNGAGKTTTIKMLSTLLQPDEGSAFIDNVTVLDGSDTLKKSIAYVAQYFGLYDELSVFDNLKFYASLYDKVEQKVLLALLEKYKLLEFKDAKAKELSGGYKRRLSLACALAHNPKVIFLDEPTAGIDPVTRKLLWDIFYELSQEGKTLFVTTHYMEEAERCNKILFLDRGKKVIEGTPNEVKNSLDDFAVYSYREKFDYDLVKFLRKSSDIYILNQFGDELRIIVKKEFAKEQLIALMAEQVKSEISLSNIHPNLEDVFIALTQSRDHADY